MVLHNLPQLGGIGKNLATLRKGILLLK